MRSTKIGEHTTEQTILKAAEELFLQQGFAKTTTMQIAHRAGCNQALVHYYYRTKENLFEQILEEKVRFIVTHFLDINSSEGTLEEKIRKMVDVHFDLFRKKPHLVPFLLGEVLSDVKRFAVMFNKVKNDVAMIYKKIDEALQCEIEQGTIRPITTLNLILTIVSLDVSAFILGTILQNALSLDDEQMSAQLDIRKNEVVEIILQQLRQ